MSGLKNRVYSYLVLKNRLVRKEYEAYNSAGSHTKLQKAAFLAKLNIHHRVMRKKTMLAPYLWYDKASAVSSDVPESHRLQRTPPVVLAMSLMKYDVISFDLFDTLVFIPFDRRECPAELSGEESIEVLCSVCSPNPYMKRVFDMLAGQEKKIVITEDTAFDEGDISALLSSCGYEGYADIILSTGKGCSKEDGGLYDILIQKHCSDGQSVIHIGDDDTADIVRAAEHGLEAARYQNCRFHGGQFRPQEMTGLIGSAYRAVVCDHFYNGISVYSDEYEYGFSAGGLLLTGYLSHVHGYAEKNGADRIVFTGYSGDILKKVYTVLFGPDKCVSIVCPEQFIDAAGSEDEYRKYLEGMLKGCGYAVTADMGDSGLDVYISDKIGIRTEHISCTESYPVCGGYEELIRAEYPVMHEDISMEAINAAREMHRGILDFAVKWKNAFDKYPAMFSISSDDASAPLRYILYR